MAKAKAKAKAKKKKKVASFGQFDMGRGTKAAKKKTRVSSDARTITGQKLTKRQRQAIEAANRRKR